MRRREFITLLGSAAATWPIAARAQQPAMPVIGFLHPGSAEANVHVVTPFLNGLRDAGYVDGQNVTIEFRWADGDGKRLPELAADLVRRKVAVIATPNSTPATLMAHAATKIIPIVFQNAADPVDSGLVASMNRPGGNVTGVSSMNRSLNLKRLGLLHELLPRATRFGLLHNPDDGTNELTLKELRAAAETLGAQVEDYAPRTSRDIDATFASLSQKKVEAIISGSGPVYLSRRVQLALLATQHKVPVIYSDRAFAEAGGLMSYGANLAAMFHDTGVYVGRILKGEKPAELPILQPTRFDFIINLVTARTLGLDMPVTLLARADEVIE